MVKLLRVCRLLFAATRALTQLRVDCGVEVFGCSVSGPVPGRQHGSRSALPEIPAAPDVAVANYTDSTETFLQQAVLREQPRVWIVLRTRETSQTATMFPHFLQEVFGGLCRTQQGQ